MTGDTSGETVRRKVGQFLVHTDPETLQRFDQTASLSAERPWTRAQDISDLLPMLWLGAPDVWNALQNAIYGEGLHKNGVLVHLSQQITVHASLKRDTQYALDVNLDGPDAKNVLRLQAIVSNDAEGAVSTLEGELAFIPFPDAQT